MGEAEEVERSRRKQVLFQRGPFRMCQVEKMTFANGTSVSLRPHGEVASEKEGAGDRRDHARAGCAGLTADAVLKCPLRGLFFPNLSNRAWKASIRSPACASLTWRPCVWPPGKPRCHLRGPGHIAPGRGRGWGCQGPWRGCAGEAKVVSYPKTQTQARRTGTASDPLTAPGPGQVSFMVEVARGALLTSQPAPR